MYDIALADIPVACDDCRSTPARQCLSPYSPRQEQLARLERLHGDFWRCKHCVLCYRHEFEPCASSGNAEDILTRIDPATSIALLGISSGELTAEWLGALAAAPGFSLQVLEEALPQRP